MDFLLVIVISIVVGLGSVAAIAATGIRFAGLAGGRNHPIAWSASPSASSCCSGPRSCRCCGRDRTSLGAGADQALRPSRISTRWRQSRTTRLPLPWSSLRVWSSRRRCFHGRSLSVSRSRLGNVVRRRHPGAAGLDHARVQDRMRGVL